jgi:hypothetical protein
VGRRGVQTYDGDVVRAVRGRYAEARDQGPVDDERFTSHYRAALDSLYERGARATLQAATDRPAPRA